MPWKEYVKLERHPGGDDSGRMYDPDPHGNNFRSKRGLLRTISDSGDLGGILAREPIRIFGGEFNYYPDGDQGETRSYQTVMEFRLFGYTGTPLSEIDPRISLIDDGRSRYRPTYSIDIDNMTPEELSEFLVRLPSGIEWLRFYKNLSGREGGETNLALWGTGVPFSALDLLNKGRKTRKAKSEERKLLSDVRNCPWYQLLAEAVTGADNRVLYYTNGVSLWGPEDLLTNPDSPRNSATIEEFLEAAKVMRSKPGYRFVTAGDHAPLGNPTDEFFLERLGIDN